MSDKSRKPARRGAWLKNPRKPRKEEVIGGGYFVFRRGDDTGRIRPSNWPFEHPTLDAARREAAKLAAQNPGYRFDILHVCGSALVQAEADAA